MDTFPTPHQPNDYIAATIIQEEAAANAEPGFCDSDQDDTLLCREEPLSPIEVLPPPPTGPSRFRLQGKNYSLTYPQCDTKKEIAAQRIEDKWGNEVKGYVVCEEDHKDGTPHLHVYISFRDKKTFCQTDCFDFIGGKHGNYQVTKSVKKWIEYVTKAGRYLAKGVDVESVKRKQKTLSSSVAESIMSGKSISDVNKENPGYVMINKRKIEEYESWVKCELAKRQKIDWIPPVLEGLTDTNLKIAEWICSNIRVQRKFKAPQLYIHGPRNHGKTSLVEWLERSLSVYHMPMNEEFYDHYSDDYDLVVMDEFKGQKTIQFMNQFLQGSPMTIRKKGSQSMKYKNLPVLILSNYRLSECYIKAANDGRLDTLECRLDIVEIDSFIDFYKSHEDLI